MRFIIVAMVLFLGACTKEPDSPIVRCAEQAGAGDIRNASDATLLTWFQKHQDIGQQVRKMCQPLLNNEPSGWDETTEGRVCRSAQTASAFYFEEKQGDGVGFVPGK